MILDEAASNSEFGAKLERALQRPVAIHKEQLPAERRANRRPAGVVNPFELAVQGENVLRETLRTLSIEQLKDIVAEHGMDRAKLVSKWKTRAKIEEHIVTVVRERRQQGSAFRGGD